MYTFITYFLVIVTTLWVGMDSHRLRVPMNPKQPYSAMNGAVLWMICCVVLWIVSFPVYLYKRARALRERGVPSTGSPVISVLGGVLVVVVAYCAIAPFFITQRLTTEELRDQVSASIQKTWHDNPATKDAHLRSLSLTHQAGPNYTGVAVAELSGREERHDVEVTYDGKVFHWKVK